MFMIWENQSFGNRLFQMQQNTLRIRKVAVPEAGVPEEAVQKVEKFVSRKG